MGFPDSELSDTTLFVTVFFSKLPSRYFIFTGINQRPASWYFSLMGISQIRATRFSDFMG